MKSIIRSIKHILSNIYNAVFSRKTFHANSLNDAILVMLAADYNNLGDVAITYAQKIFLQSKSRQIVGSSQKFPNRNQSKVTRRQPGYRIVRTLRRAKRGVS